jgi:hypothetical protein
VRAAFDGFDYRRKIAEKPQIADGFDNRVSAAQAALKTAEGLIEASEEQIAVNDDGKFGNFS